MFVLCTGATASVSTYFVSCTKYCNIDSFFPKFPPFSPRSSSRADQPTPTSRFLNLHLARWRLQVKVAFGSVWKETLTELSGGQRSLLALSLILALLLFKPGKQKHLACRHQYGRFLCMYVVFVRPDVFGPKFFLVPSVCFLSFQNVLHAWFVSAGDVEYAVVASLELQWATAHPRTLSSRFWVCPVSEGVYSFTASSTGCVFPVVFAVHPQRDFWCVFKYLSC